MFTMQEESLQLFSKNLKKAMLLSGINAASLSEKSQVSKGYISGFLSRKKPIPSEKIIHKLAEVLECSPLWLIGQSENFINYEDAMNQRKSLKNTKSAGVLSDEAFVTVPVLSWAHAGQAMTYEQMPEDYLEPMIVPADLARRNKVVGLIVDGDSMEPEICHHDHIALLPDEEPRQGCVVVAKFKEDESVMIRRYQIMETDKGKPVRVRMIPRNDFYAASEHHINEFESIIPVGAVARKLFWV